MPTGAHEAVSARVERDAPDPASLTERVEKPPVGGRPDFNRPVVGPEHELLAVRADVSGRNGRACIHGEEARSRATVLGACVPVEPCDQDSGRVTVEGHEARDGDLVSGMEDAALA